VAATKRVTYPVIWGSWHEPDKMESDQHSPQIPWRCKYCFEGRLAFLKKVSDCLRACGCRKSFFSGSRKRALV